MTKLRYATAAHEAGHAVVGWELGLPVELSRTIADRGLPIRASKSLVALQQGRRSADGGSRGSPSGQNRGAHSAMVEPVPGRPFNEAEALAWLRSQAGGRVTASAAELGRQWAGTEYGPAGA
ncbi:MAG TPA: hypothetical protein VLJ17_14645 [Xanthobacteraceae bacterium]|nr:hypothetical protein [Xanthobacteraceae bacterium]